MYSKGLFSKMFLPSPVQIGCTQRVVPLHTITTLQGVHREPPAPLHQEEGPMLCLHLGKEWHGPSPAQIRPSGRGERAPLPGPTPSSQLVQPLATWLKSRVARKPRLPLCQNSCADGCFAHVNMVQVSTLKAVRDRDRERGGGGGGLTSFRLGPEGSGDKEDSNGSQRGLHLSFAG